MFLKFLWKFLCVRNGAELILLLFSSVWDAMMRVCVSNFSVLYIHIQLSYYVSGSLVKVQLPPSPSAFLQLLQKDPAERLGNMEETDPIRRHPFFTFDWGALERREIQPPFSPSVVSTQEKTYLTVSLIYLCTVCSFCKQCCPLVKCMVGS